MTTVVDIYLKLIIAVLGFVAPTVTLLFPVFFRGIAVMKEKLVIQETQFEKLTQKELADIDKSFEEVEKMGFDSTKVKQKFKKKRLKKQHQATNNLRRSLYYFELKEQIKWIFIPLFLSLVYVMIYAVIKENIFKMYKIGEVKSIGSTIILVHSILLILTGILLAIRIKVPNFNQNLTEWGRSNNLKWLYLVILLSVISTLVYLCSKYNWFNVEDEYIKIHIEVYILMISLLLFFSTIRRLWGIVCTVIEAKPMLEENGQNSSPSQLPQNIKVVDVSPSNTSN